MEEKYYISGSIASGEIQKHSPSDTNNNDSSQIQLQIDQQHSLSWSHKTKRYDFGAWCQRTSLWTNNNCLQARKNDSAVITSFFIEKQNEKMFFFSSR